MDVSTELRKAMKLARIKKAITMVYATQCLSSKAMLNAIFNNQAEASWPTVFDNLKHTYNFHEKLSSVQMMKKLSEIKPKKGENLKVICDKIEELKVEYHDQAEILDNHTIAMHLFLVCVKLELMQAQVEAEVNGMDITYKNLIRQMNVEWRVKSNAKEVMKKGESKVALANSEFKGKCCTCGMYKQNVKNKTED